MTEEFVEQPGSANYMLYVICDKVLITQERSPKKLIILELINLNSVPK